MSSFIKRPQHVHVRQFMCVHCLKTSWTFLTNEISKLTSEANMFATKLISSELSFILSPLILFF